VEVLDNLSVPRNGSEINWSLSPGSRPPVDVGAGFNQELRGRKNSSLARVVESCRAVRWMRRVDVLGEEEDLEGRQVLRGAAGSEEEQVRSARHD